MRTLEQHITQYAAYHRDKRNLLTHAVGVPLIVLSVVLAFAQIPLGPVHAGWPLVFAAMVYYLMLDRPLGAAMAFYLFATAVIASVLSFKTTPTGGLVTAAVLFVLGWACQFWGHKYEGLKPAFLDDLSSLIIAPIFMMTEFFFFLRLKPDLQKYVEDRVGPVVAARNGAPVGPTQPPADPRG